MLVPSKLAVELFSTEIVSCYEQLSEDKHWAIASIDNCLHLGVYNDQKSAFIGFNAWMDVEHCTSRIFNITDSFRMPWVRPFGSLDLPLELLQKVFRGEVSIVLCLDVKAFVELANSMFPNYLSVASKSETAAACDEFYEYLQLDGRVINCNSARGWIVGRGVLDRIVFDLQRPSNLLEMQHAALDAG